MEQTENLQDKSYLFGAIEAILFVAGDPVDVIDIAIALDITELEAIDLVEELLKTYNDNKRGIHIQFINNKLQLHTNKSYAHYVERLFHTETELKLSQTVLETLSIIAYKQPITRAEIEALRGVKSDYSLSVLLDNELIKVSGNKDTIGRPKLYVTTDAFLSHFSIKSLSELPDKPTIDKSAD